MTGAAIIASGEASKVLQLVEAALDAVALAIERLVVPNDLLAAAVGGDHHLHAGGFDGRADGVAVVGLIGDDSATLHAVQHRLGRAAVVHLAAGQKKAQRASECIREQVDLGRQSTSGTPQSLVRSPLLAPPLPVAACWWALTRVASSIKYSFLASRVSSAKT